MTSLKDIYKTFQAFPSVVTDSRQIVPNCLFFALKGENFNGNKFAKDAIEKGAAFAVIDEPEFEIPGKTLLVENVLQTLKELANYHRKMLGLPVLAITGTNGKTTTKELVAAVLAEKYRVIFTQGNLNNHIGVPLTLLQINASTEFAVVEMGANHPGEIDELCRIAEPDYGIITNIGKAHLEGFGSFEGVIQTKTELYRYLQEKEGLIFYNKSNPLLNNLTTDIKNKISYGEKEANLIAEPIYSPPYIHLKANFSKGVLYLNTQLTGDYNFENILAAACIGQHFGVDPLKIQTALKNYQPKNNRSQLIIKEKLRITMDAYNANPTSMKASIVSFMQNAEGQCNLILGDMLELGQYSTEEHSVILNLLGNYPDCKVFLVGEQFFALAGNHNYNAFQNVELLCETLKNTPITEGSVLIKGSRGIRLEKVLNYL